MKRIYRGRTRALANIVLLGLAWWSAPAARADFNVLPPHSVVEGRTIGEWTAEWWKWAFAQSPPHDAFTDQTGANATLNQSGPVFFLAGTLGGMAERAFEVPADRFILLPLVNVSWSQAELGTDKDEAFLRARAAQDIDLVDSLSATIDGTEVTDPYAYRELSPAYSYTAPAGNLFGVPAGDSGLAAADGYWLMLSPLSPGVHEIRFGGGISSFGFSTLVTSRVTAVPEPASLALCGVMALVGLGYAGVRRRVARVA